LERKAKQILVHGYQAKSHLSSGGFLPVMIVSQNKTTFFEYKTQRNY
jgi:hypothetical protein